MLCRLPNIRLGEALEFLEEVLDSTLTAQPTCDQDLLGMTVWLLTKIKPDLRCTRYIELYDRLRKASNRIKHVMRSTTTTFCRNWCSASWIPRTSLTLQ